MAASKDALRLIYADTLNRDIVKATLDEMYRRGLPRKLYYQYLNEAQDIGLIPVAGRSKIGGRTITKEDILTRDHILAKIDPGFKSDLGFYGIG